MSREELERLDDQGLSAWDSRDADAWVGLFADEFQIRDVSLPEPITTKEGARQYMEAWSTAFPDMRVKLLNRAVGEDSVAAELEFTGTNTGPMMMGGKEIPPTGKSVVGGGMYFARVKDGKVIEFSSHPDIAGMMMQLGFMPPM